MVNILVLSSEWRPCHMNNDVINFGSYWQKSDKNFGKQPIEWYIVAREDNDLLLLSKYALSGVYYGYKYSEDWKHSIAREWMAQFVEDAFDRYERSVLVQYRNMDDNLIDTAFLLSYAELRYYHVLENLEVMRCFPTPFAQKRLFIDSDLKTCEWWLRSYGSNDYIGYKGKIGYYATPQETECGIRPAVWMRLGR